MGRGAVFPTCLTLTFSSAIAIIHWLYAVSARRAKEWFTSESGGLVVNRAAGTIFMIFGIVLATAKI